MCSRSSLPEPSPSQEGSHCLPCSTPHQQSGADSPKWHQLVPGTRSQYLPCWISQGSTSDHGEGDGWHPTPVLLPGKSHGWWSLVGAAVHGVVKSLTLRTSLSLSCIGEGNGNPLQCSCLENPRDGGAWWAAVYGVAQSWTRLKRFSSSISSPCVQRCYEVCYLF